MPSSHARVPACLAILALCQACGGNDVVEPVPVVSVVVHPDSVSLQVGETAQLTASVRDGAGKELSGRTVVWSSADPSTVTVSASGLVTAMSAGHVAITATCEGQSGNAVVAAEAGLQDYAVTDAQFTQGVQAANGSIPMVLGGGAAVVNVLVRAATTTSASTQLVLRLFDPSGGLVRADTATTRGPLGPTPSYLAPSAQFLLPSSLLQPGMQWQLVRDPKGLLPDDSTANDAFPRGGRAALATVSVPGLRVRFVPIVLASHGNATGAVSNGTLPEYLRTALSVHPLGTVSGFVGTPFTTSASFGTPPSGGAAPFWQQVLGELDLARIADTDSQVHWYGVVAPPPGFTYTAYGGFAYIPLSGQSTGPGTRTAVGVQIGWFNRPTQSRDLVAHELAHHFGRTHAPCGGASAVDASFPYAGGVIGLPGHDVYAWANGIAASAAPVDPQTGDVMGYCFPAWSSDYTFRGILQFRQPPVIAAGRPGTARTEPVLVVRGTVEAGRPMTLEPAFVFTARPTRPERTGAYRLEGFTVDGRVLFAYDFEPAVLDHAPDARHFMFAIPATVDLETSLYSLRVRGPEGDARLTRPAGAQVAPPPGPVPQAQPLRGADGLVSIACAGTTARGMVVLDAATGAVLGTAARPSMRVLATPGTRLTVACSDGIRTTRASAVAP